MHNRCAQRKDVAGCYYGSASAEPRFSSLDRAVPRRPVKLDELINAPYSIEEAPQAFADLNQGARAAA